MKSVIDSKTIWFNIVCVIMLVLTLPQLTAILPAAFLPYIALSTAVGNIVLRVFFTSQPVTQFAAHID